MGTPKWEQHTELPGGAKVWSHTPQDRFSPTTHTLLLLVAGLRRDSQMRLMCLLMMMMMLLMLLMLQVIHFRSVFARSTVSL